MEKRLIKYATSLLGVAISVFVFFKYSIDIYIMNKYMAGGTSYTYEMLNQDFIYNITQEKSDIILFVFSFCVCTYYAITSFINIKPKTQRVISVIFGVIVFPLSVFYLYTVEIEGEGLEIFFLAPLAFAAAIIELIVFILMLIKTKRNQKSQYFLVYSTVSIIFGLLLIPFYSLESSILLAPLVSAIALLNHYLSDKCIYEYDKLIDIPKIIVSIITVVAIVIATFFSYFGYKDITKRKALEEKGYIYVGNDGKEKERASFKSNGLYGYYAHKEDLSSYIEYQYGEYCIVEGFDFSSENVTLPNEINGKPVVYNNEFFAFLAQNKDKYNDIIIDEKIDYIKNDDFILDKTSQRSIYIYIGNDEEITIPENVKRIHDYAFSNKNIKKITLNDNVEILSKRCFENCPVKEMNFPNGTDTFSTDENAEILGTAPELETLNIGKRCNRCNIGKFNEDVRTNNEKKNKTLTVNTKSRNDLLKLGTMLYNYENVIFNIDYDKTDYYEQEEYFSSYNIQNSDFYKEFKDCHDNTINLTKSINGKTYNTTIKVNFIGDRSNYYAQK